MSSQLHVSERWLDQAIRLIVLRGELDRATTPQLAVILRKAVARTRPLVVVDLMQVTAAEPSALALLHRIQMRAEEAGGCVALAADGLRSPPAFVGVERSGSIPRERRLAAVALTVFASREEAIAAARRGIVSLGPQAVRSVLDVPVG
jgi:ABC-type transporter Mla MlaB component